MTFQPICAHGECQGSILPLSVALVRYTALPRAWGLTPIAGSPVGARKRDAELRIAMDAADVLERVGERVRTARGARQWTLRELAERSGVSVRFLVQLESGQGNISVKRLAELASALQVSVVDLIDDRVTEGPRVIALLGLRGAGKTTIGKQLARRLHARFVELDRRIEK